VTLPFTVGVPGKCASRQRLAGAPDSSEASWLPRQHWVYAACLCALQALKRKPDLFLCSNLDVKAVFQCGEYHGHTLQMALQRGQPAPPVEPGADQPGGGDHRAGVGAAGDHRAAVGWCAGLLTGDLGAFCPQVSFHSSSLRPPRSKHPVAFL